MPELTSPAAATRPYPSALLLAMVLLLAAPVRFAFAAQEKSPLKPHTSSSTKSAPAEPGLARPPASKPAPAPRKRPAAQPGTGQTLAPPKRNMPGAGLTSPASARIAGFLDELQRASSAEQLSASFKRANFSQTELRELAAELRKPRHASAIARLKQAASRDARRSAVPAHRGKAVAAVVAEKNRSLARSHAQRISQRNREVLSRTPSSAPMRTTRRPAATRIVNAVPLARAPSRVEPSTARIDGVEPAAVVGQRTTITGTGFGSERGQVAALVGESLVYFTVSSWRHDRIEVTVPESLQPDIDDIRHDGMLSHVRVRLWVKLHGGETGPMRDISIYPDVTQFVPEITGVFPLEVSPGSELLIEGRNFLDEIRQVTLRFGHDELNVEVHDWSDTHVRGRVQNLPAGGWSHRSAGTVNLANRLLQEDTHGGLVFVPEEEIVALDEGGMSAVCQPLFPPLLCLAGETNHFRRFDALTLADGWVVDDVWLERVHGQGPGYGAYFETEPAAGAANTRTDVAVWANAWSVCEYKVNMTVRGPKGTRYFR